MKKIVIYSVAVFYITLKLFIDLLSKYEELRKRRLDIQIKYGLYNQDDIFI